MTGGAQDNRLLHKDAATSTTTQSAALKGALLAYGAPPLKPKPQANTYSGNNGALAAATKAGGPRTIPNKASNSSIRSAADDNFSGHLGVAGSSSSRPSARQTDQRTSQQRLNQYDPRNGTSRPNTDYTRSTSYLAANVAASRSASVSPNVTGQQQKMANLGREISSTRRTVSPVKSIRSTAGSSDRSLDLDLTPIPPTTSLIDMFERSGAPSQSRPQIERSRTSAPQKNRSPSSQISPRPSRARTPPPLAPKSQKLEVKSSEPSLARISSLPKEYDLAEPKKGQKPPVPASKPVSIPTKPLPKRQPVPQPQSEDDDASDDSFVSASDYKPSFRAALTNQKRRLTSASAVSVNSAGTIDSMANAIVASSLASSRAASPSISSTRNSLLAPPPPPSRRSPRGHIFHNNPSRTPSPAKHTGLRTTLRKPKSKEELDEGEKRRTKKAHLMKKHPNKHHEGDRKRWRDEITERERKRYEAVWASNKGIYISSVPGAENTVCNLVVRDIWDRSRLHSDVLEEVYALVDREGNGTLDKEGFVVGLWLIDQRLKGRKLPIRVSESVWKSVGIMAGIKVKKIKR
ncbi:hypothetical protein G7Y89_g105 [Cudoniella acicularis]|uniref:EH domain-containing protein n=1 Tax=Cudoniella acicularis TaxID=354080 RepID=A0A8H4RZC3_9HELO|nr:hypothetical protein G7Y89_g105 [Cudoniella acicularis]